MGCENLGGRARELVDRPLPPDVRSAAERALLNVAAAAIGGSRHEVVEKIVRLSADHGGTPAAAIVGRQERSDAYFSALAGGTAARVLDFDDIHLSTHLNPSAAPFGILVALASTRQVAGGRALRAFALGCEVAIRLASVASPHHFEAGWDATGTCGVIGAAVCGALLLDANALQVTNAIGIAASETLGQREALGTLSGTLHAGKAASNGLIAALLAKQGFTGSSRLDHPDGFFTVFPVAERSGLDAIVADLGERWQLLENRCKPIPGSSLSHVRGILLRPMSDDELFVKVQGLVEPMLPGASDPLRAAVRGLNDASSAAYLIAALTPQGAEIPA